MVFELLATALLTLNLANCEFGQTTVTYLLFDICMPPPQAQNTTTINSNVANVHI